MKGFFDYLVVVMAVINSILILILTRGASLGSSFGSSAEINTVRRGADRTLHQMTIICVIVFVMALIFSVIS